MRDVIVNSVFIAAFCAACYGFVSLFANATKDHEIIQPKQGVECVVVSRMFNTSVDCNWSE